jgi:hypothetical protein
MGHLSFILICSVVMHCSSFLFVHYPQSLRRDLFVVRVRGRLQGFSTKVFTLGGETILYPHPWQEWN